MICERLTVGVICKGEDMPAEGIVRRWALSNEEFAPQYARGRQIGYYAMANQDHRYCG
jgi:hypothetical protein